VTLKYTLDQVRERELAHVGTVGTPNDWWPLDYGNGCLKFQMFCLGVASRHDMELRHISIGSFLDTRDKSVWQYVPAEDIRPGDLAFQNWVGDRDPDHVEMTYSKVGNKLTTTGANTGPAAGVTDPRGAWKKTREIGSWLAFGVRPPYKPVASTVSTARRAQVRLNAAFVNKALGGADTPAAKDGIPGPLYWTLVQTWGRAHGLYPARYVIDGVPGPQTYKVEAAVHAKAKAAPKKK
jgi:hypothetical protein